MWPQQSPELELLAPVDLRSPAMEIAEFLPRADLVVAAYVLHENEAALTSAVPGCIGGAFPETCHASAMFWCVKGTSLVLLLWLSGDLSKKEEEASSVQLVSLETTTTTSGCQLQKRSKRRFTMLPGVLRRMFQVSPKLKGSLAIRPVTAWATS